MAAYQAVIHLDRQHVTRIGQDVRGLAHAACDHGSLIFDVVSRHHEVERGCVPGMRPPD
jgi:hypothetical protein